MLHEGPLPHVLVNMEPEPKASEPNLDELPEQSPSIAGDGSAAAAIPAVNGGSSGSPAAGATRETGPVGSRVAVVNAASRGTGGPGLGGDDGGGWERRASGVGVLSEIGPPKRVMLLPEVHPR